jgi:endonuclease IV
MTAQNLVAEHPSQMSDTSLQQAITNTYESLNTQFEEQIELVPSKTTADEASQILQELSDLQELVRVLHERADDTDTESDLS